MGSHLLEHVSVSFKNYFFELTLSFNFSTLAPVRSATSSLFLMNLKVGIAVILYLAAMSSHSSTSTFRNMTSVMFLLISSRWGEIILQGPHHVAKKSTTTKFPPASSSFFRKSSMSFTE